MSMLENISTFQNLIYIASSILFISGIKMLGKEETAVKGNFLSALAMFIAVVITFIDPKIEVNIYLIFAGIGVGALIGSLIALILFDDKKRLPFFFNSFCSSI